MLLFQARGVIFKAFFALHIFTDVRFISPLFPINERLFSSSSRTSLIDSFSHISHEGKFIGEVLLQDG
jgi:hypothetical protein